MRLKKPESFYEVVSSDLCFPGINDMTYRREFREYTPIRQVEHLVAKDGSNQPPSGHHAKRAQSHQHERIQSTELGR